jgi:serine/threonine protein kinase
VEDESVKDLLYNLGLDFERKRMFNKAVAVYQHIAQAGAFKDIDDRIKKLTTAGETMIFGLSGAKKEATVIMDNTEIKPTLGRYEIVKELGRGAMGTVFLGKDPRINREVAIKTLRYEEIDAEQIDEVKKRFFREAEAAGSIDQLTDDHSMAQEQVKRNLITQEEADQSEMKNILTKALGIQPEMEADLDELTVMDGDILLLCTGGFSNMVTDDDALDIISSAQNASAACESMIDAANRNGGKDNITVVIGYVWKKKGHSALMKFMEFFRR